MLHSRIYITVFVLFIAVTGNTILAQNPVYKPGPGSYVAVKGTSTLHDWEMRSGDILSEVRFVKNEEGEPEDIQELVFRLNKTTLKSDQSGLDRRAYDALKANRFPEISFKMNGSSSVQRNGERYVIRSTGDLSVAGTTRQIRINATCVNGDGDKLVCTGSQTLKMSDFNIDPPVMMLGALRTGDEVTINYNIVLTQ